MYQLIVRKMARTATDNAGMTLIELMITAGIMAVAFVFIIGGIASISTTRAIVEDQALAASTLSSTVEEVKTLSYNDLLAYVPAPPSQLGTTRAVEVRCYAADGTAYALPVDPDVLPGPLPNPLETEIRVTWRDDAGRPLLRRASVLLRR